MKTKRNLCHICLLGVLLSPVAVLADFTYTTANNQITITGYSGTVPSALVIPDTINGLPVVGIGDNAFYNDIGVTSLTISTNVISIGDNAFSGDNAGINVTNLIIPDSVTSIGIEAFYECIHLRGVTIGDGVTNLGEGAFSYCVSLTGVTIGKRVSTMGAAFGNDYIYVIYLRGNAPVDTDEWLDEDFLGPIYYFYYQVGTTGWGTNNFDGDLYFDGYITRPFFLVVNGGFEADSSDDTGDFFGWTVSGTGSSQITSSGAYSGQFAAIFTDTASKPGVHGTIAGTSSALSQTLPTQAGASYVLSFALNGIANGDCSVAWNGSTLLAQNLNNPGWTTYQFIVTATTTSTVLQFTFPPRFQLVATTALDSVSLLPLPQLNDQIMSGGNVNLSAFTGNINANYALDRTFNLALPITWTPQVTNASDGNGMLAFTNAPNVTTNNFWRVRSVP